MRLTRKLVLGLVLGILLVHSASAVVRVRREIRLLEGDIARDEQVLAHALGLAVERTWSESGERAALDLVEHANARESHIEIRWVSLEDPAGAGLPRRLVEAARAGKPREILDRTDDAIHTYAIVDLPDGRQGALLIVDRIADETDYIRGSARAAAIAAAVLIALCAAIAWGVGAFFIGRPIRALVDQARRIGGGDLSSHVHLQQNDEIGELSSEMNRMADSLVEARERAQTEASRRLDAVAQLRHADRLTTVGTLAAGIAHELGTPINVITGYGQLILEDPAAKAGHDHAAVIVDQAGRITAIVRQLLDFARRGEVSSEANGPPSCDCAEVLRSTMGLLDAIFRSASVDLEMTADEPLPAAIAPGELQQVLTNLAMNAVQAMPDGGVLRIVADTAARGAAGAAPAPHVRITVEDHGCGIPAELLERVFEPFFTTKDVGRGTGLGLAVAWGIMNDRHGCIEVESEAGRGTKFTVWIPSSPASPATS